jgi:hypothetical protein
MRVYSFSIRSTAATPSEYMGRMALPNDKAARDFGEAMIRDMLRDGPAPYAGRTVNVTQSARTVCGIHIR